MKALAYEEGLATLIEMRCDVKLSCSIGAGGL